MSHAPAEREHHRGLPSPFGLTVALLAALFLAGVGLLLTSPGRSGRGSQGSGFGAAAFSARVSTPASSSACSSAQLSVRLGPRTGAAGHQGQTVGLVNTSAASCTLDGYPGLLMLDSSGRPMPTRAVPEPGSSPEEVVVPPGGEVSFMASWADATGYGSEQCPVSSRVAITPPGAQDPIPVAWKVAPYGGATPGSPCGSILVSPVKAG